MAGDKLWLRDFFPHISPKARIMLFGYNANVAFETSAAGIREQAENLLNWLKIERKVFTLTPAPQAGLTVTGDRMTPSVY